MTIIPFFSPIFLPFSVRHYCKVGHKQGDGRIEDVMWLSSLLFFLIQPLFGSSRHSHSQGILSLLHNLLSAQVTEDFHRTIRQVWPHFQLKFCPCGDRSRQAGQTCAHTLSGVKAMAPLLSPTKKRSLFQQELFPLNVDPLGSEPVSP